MNDLISRQAAIDAIKNMDVVVLYYDGEPIDEVIEETIEAMKCSIVAGVENLPSAKPVKKCIAEIKISKDDIKDLVAEKVEEIKKAQPDITRDNDCYGCKFVGCYDTDFPCANCVRKDKDYYEPEG